jgi:hypothetical protein
MKGIKNARRNRVPEAVSFRVGGIANEDTRVRASVEFRRGRGDESEGATAYFAEVGQGGYATEPKFVRCTPSVGNSGH